MEFTKDINFSTNLKEGTTVTITYSGELFKNNSDSVTIVYGFGETWEFTTEQEMQKKDTGFTADIELLENFNKFNFCFRNSNYVWDNNYNCNYVSEIQPLSLEELLGPKEEIDENLIIELLDSLLNENINYDKEEIVDEDSKQQILDDILTENTSYSWIEDFDMDQLVENILNPVINYATSEEEENLAEAFKNEITKEYFTEDETVLENVNENLETSIENTSAESAQYFSESTIDESTTEIPEPSLLEDLDSNKLSLMDTHIASDNYLVSPRQLSRFYLIKKKIKLAFYKLFIGLPKLLSGEFGKSKD